MGDSGPELPLSPAGLICADVTSKLLHCSLSASRFLPLKQLTRLGEEARSQRNDDCEVKAREGLAAEEQRSCTACPERSAGEGTGQRDGADVAQRERGRSWERPGSGGCLPRRGPCCREELGTGDSAQLPAGVPFLPPPPTPLPLPSCS